MLVIKEYEKIKPNGEKITLDDFNDLKAFMLENEKMYSPIFTIKNDYIQAKNYVGVVEVNNRKPIEILPKVELCSSEEDTRKIFLRMLRTWRGWRGNQLKQINQSNIRALHRFNMQEIFYRLFLNDLVLLTQRGLARKYFAVEDNVPVLKGRILFPQHFRTNIVDYSRFYVEYDEFSTNRAANRLIHLTIDNLIVRAKDPRNSQLLKQMKINFIEIPKSENMLDDWTKHTIDRSMQHYNSVMQWIGMFLFGHGLATFSGKHLNQSLLFPMEKIYEDYVAQAFKSYPLKNYDVKTHNPRKHLAVIGNKNVFEMIPDICLLEYRTNIPKIILDTKWKRIDESQDKINGNHGIVQGDVYQLFAYGKKYGCEYVGLIYPKTENYDTVYHYIIDELNLFCFPFDLTNPKNSVKKILEHLP